MVHGKKRKTASLSACRWEKNFYLVANATILSDLDSDVYGSTTPANKK